MVRSYVHAGPVTLGDSAGTAGALLVGNFDGDPDDEILRVHPQIHPKDDSSDQQPSELFDVDGTKRKCNIPGKGFITGGIAWDCDGDGICEVVPDPQMFSFEVAYATGVSVNTPAWEAAQAKELPIIRISGEEAFRLPLHNVSTSVSAMLLDWDGDGTQDLLLGESKPFRFVIWGERGRKLWSQEFPEWPIMACGGDFDGDGKDELLYSLIHAAYHVSGSDPPKKFNRSKYPRANRISFDIDNDGIDELLSANGEVWNIKGGVLFSLSPFKGMLMPDKVVCADLYGDSRNEIALAEGGLESKIYLYDDHGQRIYEEQLGDIVFHLAKAKAKGRDHLIVQTSGRLLIFP